MNEKEINEKYNNIIKRQLKEIRELELQDAWEDYMMEKNTKLTKRVNIQCQDCGVKISVLCNEIAKIISVRCNHCQKTIERIQKRFEALKGNMIN